MQHTCMPERASIENLELEVEEQRRQEDRPVPRNKVHSFLPWPIKGYKGHQASETSDLHRDRARDHSLNKCARMLGRPLSIGNRRPPPKVVGQMTGLSPPQGWLCASREGG